MKLTNRQFKLACLLIEQEGYNTVAYFAHALGVSKRTVHNDLNVVESYLSINGYVLMKKAGVGINVTPKVLINEIVEQIYEPELSISPFQRQQSIMKDLLFNNEQYTYQRLSDAYFVSPSSIQIDIKRIKELYIDKSTAQLVSDSSGTYLVGDEEQLRSTFLRFNQVCVKNTELKFNKQTQQICLSQNYGKKLTNACLQIVKELENSNISFIADHYKTNLLNVLVIISYRSSKGNYIETIQRELVVNEIKQMPYITLAKDILGRINNVTEIQFNECDYDYLAKYLRANRIVFSQTSILEDSNISDIIERIIENSSNALDVDLRNDESLKIQLFTHIQSMIYRLKTGITIKNALLPEIKEEFRVLFDVVWVVINEVFSEINLTISEDEVGFILIYIQTALDKEIKSKRVLIVCPNGISTSQLIVNRIRRMLPPLDIVEASSINKAISSDLSQFDFIISTTSINIDEKPVVTISPLLTERDIIKISQFYNKTFVIDQDSQENDRQGFRTLLKYMPEELIVINQSLGSREKVIKEMCKLLVRNGIVSNDYEEAVLFRESLGTTELNSGSAIPHGNLKFVNRTMVGLCILKKPIKWNDSLVKVVAFPCIKQEDTHLVRDIFQDVFRLLNVRENIEELSICESKEQVIGILEGAFHDK